KTSLSLWKIITSSCSLSRWRPLTSPRTSALDQLVKESTLRWPPSGVGGNARRRGKQAKPTRPARGFLTPAPTVHRRVALRCGLLQLPRAPSSSPASWAQPAERFPNAQDSSPIRLPQFGGPRRKHRAPLSHSLDGRGIVPEPST